MNDPNPASVYLCSRATLLEYLDGELSAEKEHEVLTHLESCTSCRNELEHQKALLSHLENSLTEMPELPSDFSKVVSANARSQVSGIRHWRERRFAIVISVGLAAIILLALLFGPVTYFAGGGAVLEKAGSVVSLVVGLFSDVLLSVGIVGRAVSSRLGPYALIAFAIIACVFLFAAVRRGARNGRSVGSGRVSR